MLQAAIGGSGKWLGFLTHVRLGDTIRVHTRLAVFETYSPPAAYFSSSRNSHNEDLIQHQVSAISFGLLPKPGCWQADVSDVNQVDLRTALTFKQTLRNRALLLGRECWCGRRGAWEVGSVSRACPP